MSVKGTLVRSDHAQRPKPAYNNIPVFGEKLQANVSHEKPLKQNRIYIHPFPPIGIFLYVNTNENILKMSDRAKTNFKSCKMGV